MAINKEIIIDFPLPRVIKNTMEDTENAYAEGGEYGAYMNWVDTLDNVCKIYVTEGVLSQKQWDIIMSRYQLED